MRSAKNPSMKKTPGVGSLAEMEEPVYLFFVGTAGSGKTTMVEAFGEWCRSHGISTTTVNLDPGAGELPYQPDVDIREWLSLREVMEEYGLGPNGAQIAAADMLALHIPEVKKALDEYVEDYVLVDTPGQIELFAFRKSSGEIVEKISGGRALLVYLFDPNLARTPTGFISALLLSVTVQSRFFVPAISVLSKADLLDKRALDQLRYWEEDIYNLYRDAVEEKQTMHTVLNVQLLKALEDVGVATRVYPVSSITRQGMEDVYTAVQNVYHGGEDIGDFATEDAERML